ncbi:RNA-directed DNA polymerase, eukaryota [Tanacetum coccineum]|uniref:RNA-directed DNA polymerase, eukaryota n=1 Tax=Tanacetum coccineum TaxID=301880 RepID=A0ABQ4Y8I3_9ASTR
MVKDTLKSLVTVDSNGMINLKKKLQALKIAIKQWTKYAKKSSYKAKIPIQSKLSDIDKILDQGGSNEEILFDRSFLLKELNDIDSIDSLEAAQKSKVRWAIEGDENTNFFHGLFLGIPIDSSLKLSHLFFADDAIFVRKWDSLNICTIVNVLKSFHLASGLKINFQISKLMVGGAISRIKSWDDVVAKVLSRLSKWKLKTLSIGGLFIKAIYGKDGALNSPSSLSKRSHWLDIIREVTVLRTKGINLLDLIRKKVWSLEATCEFFVKSVRQLIDDSILPKEEVATRWVKVMPIKINVLYWRVCLDKLPTRLNLSLKGIDTLTIVSPLCHASVEFGSHILFSCPMARHLWRQLMRWWELEDIDLASYDDWLIWLNSSRLSKRLKKILEGVCLKSQGFLRQEGSLLTSEVTIELGTRGVEYGEEELRDRTTINHVLAKFTNSDFIVELVISSMLMVMIVAVCFGLGFGLINGFRVAGSFGTKMYMCLKAMMKLMLLVLVLFVFKFYKFKYEVMMSNRDRADVCSVGTVQMKFTSGKTMTLHNVLHVHTISKSLVFVGKLDEHGFKIAIESKKVVIAKCDLFVGKGYYKEGMYRLNVENELPKNVLDSNILDSPTVGNQISHVSLRSNFDSVVDLHVHEINQIFVCIVDTVSDEISTLFFLALDSD